jgi:hypothetical protein
MAVVVITPPEPIVDVSDIPGSWVDQEKERAIRAMCEEIDGPSGWLGVALGPQVLELQESSFGMWKLGKVKLPYPPLIEVQSIKYEDADGVEQLVDSSDYTVRNGWVRLKSGFTWPAVSPCEDAVRVRYRAGYDGEATGSIPQRARQAVILGASDYLAVSPSETAMLRSESIEGVGSQTFVAPAERGLAVRATMRNLLATLQVLEA